MEEKTINKQTQKELKEKLKAHKTWVALFIAVVLVVGTMFWYYQYKGMLLQLFIGAVVATLALVVSVTYENVRRKFWEEFATKNGWDFIDGKLLLEERAMIFKTGHDRITKNCIQKKYKDNEISIFEYEYTIGKGKNRSVFKYTIFEIKFSGFFPHIFLDYKHKRDEIAVLEKKIPLPSEFEKQFYLFAPQKYEIEALEIFTTDTLQFLLDNNWSHDLELIDSELIIHRRKQFSDFENLESEVNKVFTFIDHLFPKLENAKYQKIGDLKDTLY